MYSICSFEGAKPSKKAQWLSWLERRPVTAEVVGSNPIWVVRAKARQTGNSYRNSRIADVAQLAEQLICNQQVIGSSPIIGLHNWMGSRVAKGGRL